MRNLVLYAFLSLLLVQCTSNSDEQQRIHAIWRLSARESLAKGPRSGDPLLEESKQHEAGQEGLLLCIFPDQSYTLLNEAGFYEEGAWEWIDEGERIRLSSGKKRIEYEVTLTAQEDDQAELVLKDKKAKHVWQRQAPMLQKWKEDEFYSSNNAWRIKPSKPESTDQLIQRLGNYFKHTTYLLKGADQRDVDVVSFSYADGVVKIYNSGIGVKEWEYISAEWKNSFYSEAQAKEACELFRNYLNNYPYNGTGSSDWVKDDYFLMLHIYNDLMEGKFKVSDVESKVN
jgi:hypothetical protein